MSGNAALDDRPANTRWMPPGLRPPGGMSHRQAVVFWLVGAAMLLGGYDTNIFFFSVAHVQASLNIPEDKIGLTASIVRLAAFGALILAWSADIVGRRRLLLFTIIGQACATLATAFSQNYEQYIAFQMITRVFGYAEEMLCYVVIAEELNAKARGWATGSLATLYYAGAGVTAALFSVINVLPYGWRSLYVIGSIPLFAVAYLRRYLPETRRFETREHEVQKLSSHIGGALDMFRRLMHEHPRRVATLLIAIAAYGFAIWPNSSMAVKYLISVLHLTPPQASLIMLAGGLIAAGLNIVAGRLSDRIGRRRVIFVALLMAVIGYGTLYSGVHWRYVSYMWAVGFFGFVCADSLFAGLSAEIFPTAYRATVSGLRYMVSIMAGAIGLALEGPLYDYFGGHGPALLVFLCSMPVAMIALFKLPEPAGRELEEIATESDA